MAFRMPALVACVWIAWLLILRVVVAGMGSMIAIVPAVIVVTAASTFLTGYIVQTGGFMERE